MIRCAKDGSSTRTEPTIDLPEGSVEPSCTLVDIPASSVSPDPRPKRRRRRRRWIILGLAILCITWLNGPGLRVFAPKIAGHFLEKAGLIGTFKLTGNLVGGFGISNLYLTGDQDLASLTVNKITPDYRWSELLHGRLDGLKIEGLHADLRLGLPPKNRQEPSTSLDLKKMVASLRSAREKLIPMDIQLEAISLTATRDSKPVFQLAPSRFSHLAGSNTFQFQIGTITDATARQWPAQIPAITWTSDTLSVEKIDPIAGVSVRNLTLQLPATGVPSAELEAHLNDAVFFISSAPGFASLRVDLREGRLELAKAVKPFGIELPANATLTSLAVELDQVLPNPKLANGSVRLLLENGSWKDWQIPEIGLDVDLTKNQTTLVTRLLMLGSEFSLDTSAPVSRSENTFSLGDVTGKFSLANVATVLRELATRVPAIDPDAAIPASSIAGDFKLALLQNQPQSASANLVLKPQDDQLASPITLSGQWTNDQTITAELGMDGCKVNATYQATTAATYQAKCEFDEFSNTRIDPWIAAFKIKPGGTANLTGIWSGSGEIKPAKHRGELSLSQATWSRESAAPITAIGGVRYEWPGNVEIQGLRVQMNDQNIALDAALANQSLELKRFLWSDGKTELAEGTASLPVPEDFSKWRDALAKDTRPLALSIKSRVLSLGLLKAWVPALEQLDPRSSGQIDLQLSGTFSEPIIDAKLEAKDLRSPSQPKLPPADLKILLNGRDGNLILDGSATAPDFAPALIKATMPFHPSQWAETPQKIMDEAVTARVDLPRLDLARFSSLVSTSEQLSGILTGNIAVSGKVGKPEIKGTLNLSNAGMRFKGDRFPNIEAASAQVDFSLEKITLKNLKCTAAGGTLQGGASLSLVKSRPGDIDLRLRGNHLPLVRNDFLIVRANADLRLQGPWERAVLSGTVGAVDSLFYRDIELLPIGTPFTGPAAASLPKIDPPRNQASSMPEPFRNWGINLLVRTEEAFLIRGNLASGEVSANIRVGGTLEKPAPDGVVTIQNFKAALPFSTLAVRSGTVTFKPATGFDPILEIRGTAEPRPYRVTVYAYGQASNPQLLLTSNPPLPENEIMTLLATGTTTSGLSDPQAASSRALQLLAEELRRGRFRFGKQLRPLLGLIDRVDFSVGEKDPYSNDAFSTATISITDRWFISTGVSEEGESRTLALWRISFR